MRTLLGLNFEGTINVHQISSGDMALNNLLKDFSDLFNNKLGGYTGEKVHFKIKQGAEPIFCKPRTIPFAFKQKVGLELDRLEQLGIITKVNNSEWGTPLVPVPKPNGDLRLCGDYKITINRVVEDIKEPLPRIEEIFSELSGGEYFTRLDMTAAYNQLEVTEETKHLLAWSTHKGIYKVNRLTFGPKPAVGAFVKRIKKVLQGAKETTFFVDDITVTGKNKQEHLANLKEVFKRLKEAGLKLNLDKCKFFKKK